MRRYIVIPLFLFAVTVSSVYGQLSVNLQLDRDTFLLYESIPVTLSIRNFSARPIELGDAENSDWLRIMVTDENNNIIPSTGKAKLGGSVLIGPGQTVSRSVDLLPLYELRARGNYRVQAQILAGAINATSQTMKFTIIHGRELARITTGVSTQGEHGEEFRTYTLLAHAAQESERFYICVADDKKGLVYGLIFLGMRIPVDTPELLTDQHGEAHVIFQNGPRSFGYVRVSPNAEIKERAVYTDTLTKPTLMIRDGVVVVHGGEKVNPKPDHIMTKDELNPPPPPPVKPKKHWWWPFGSNASTNKPPEAPRNP